jgi:4-amino-4-deoxy-L-arabinose transferase-like glycosyltransferase
MMGFWRGRAIAGMLAAVMLATALHYTWLARTGRIDMPLSFAVAGALCCFYIGLERTGQQHARGAWLWSLPAYLAAAAAVLLKGPIGLVLPASAALAYLLLEGKRVLPQPRLSWLLARKVGLWWGIPLVLALALPWFIWADIQTDGKLFQVFFWKHNFERGFGAGSLPTHPWWFYGPRLSFDFLPWSLLLPAAVWLLVRRGWWSQDPEARFGLVWSLAMVVVLSLSRFKRADYLLPAYPGAALFLGCIAERFYKERKYRAIYIGGLALLLCALVVGWWVYLVSYLPSQEPRQEFRRFAEQIRRRAPAPQLILFFRTEAHALAFHVGRPIDTILEWENLDVWASRPGTYYVVMPPTNAEEWPRYVKSGRLEEVLRSSDLGGGPHAHPLVLLRTTGGNGGRSPACP